MNPAFPGERQRKQKYVPLPPHYRASTRSSPLASHDTVSKLSQFKGDYIRCKHCGKVIPESEIVVSGYDSQSGLRHIRCPNCKKRITHTIGPRSKKDIIKGVGIAAVGVATIAIGGPVAGVFAAQAGTFLSLYGSLTALMSPGQKKKKKALRPPEEEKP